MRRTSLQSKRVHFSDRRSACSAVAIHRRHSHSHSPANNCRLRDGDYGERRSAVQEHGVEETAILGITGTDVHAPRLICSEDARGALSAIARAMSAGGGTGSRRGGAVNAVSSY
jgi:hypothetical protein